MRRIKNDNKERRFNAQVIYPIISQGDVIGSVVLMSKDDKKKMTETEEKGLEVQLMENQLKKINRKKREKLQNFNNKFFFICI